MKGKFVFMRVSIVSILFIFSIFFSNNIIAQSCTPPAVPYITGTSITAGWNLLSTTTHGFSSAWSETLAATNPNKSYKLVVTGTWGIANSVVHRDAAFDGITLPSPILNQGCDANWTFNGVCHPPVPNTTFAFSPSHTYEYVFAGQAGGIVIGFLDGQYSDNSGSLTFKLYENTGTESFCIGGSTVLTSSVASNNQWYKDGVAINVNGTNQTLTISSAGVYTVKGTNGANCFSAESNPITASASVVTYNVIPDTIKVCGTQATVNAGTGFTSYVWSTGETTSSITANSTRSYKVTLVDNNGCTASDSSYVSLVKANILNNDTTICSGASITLSIDSILISYNKWQRRLTGKEIYNVKKDLYGNLYALPSWNNDKIYKSIDRGNTWVQLSSFPALGDHNFMALGVDANNSIYASTNHNGMYRSMDNGASWSNVQDFGFGCGPMDIVFTTATGSVLTVKGSSRGIWYSNNSNNWTQKIGGLDPPSVTKDIYGNVYASGFYKSTDNGLNWTTLSSAYDGFVVRADNLGNVYTTSSPTSSPLYKSSNQGSSFTNVHPLNFSMTNGAYTSDILFSKKIMFLAKGQVFYSYNGGSQFRQVDTIKYTTANPSGYYSNPTFRMELLDNRLLVATTDGVQFIDINEQPFKIKWSTGDTTNSITVTPGTTTTYTVTITDGITTCQDQVVVAINNLGGFNPLQDTTTACGQKNTILNAGAGFTSYTWNTGANTQTATASITGKHFVSVTNAQGCTAIDSTFVNLLGINIINSDSTICSGDSVLLTSTSFSVGQNLSTVINNFNTLAAFENNGQGSTTLTNDGISGNALTINRPALVRTLKQDYGYGTYEIDAKAGDNISNQGLLLLSKSADMNNANPLIIVDSRVSGTDDVGWAFWFNGTKVASATGVNPVAYPNWYHIKVRYTPDSLRFWLNNTLLYETANPPAVSSPTGSVIISTYSLSKYDNFSYTPYVITKSILWSTGETTETIKVKPSATTTYTAKVSNGYTSCQDQVVITVTPPPTITAAGPTTFCKGASVVLSSSTNSGNQWYKNGVPISPGGNSQQITITDAGVYSLTANSSGNCLNVKSANSINVLVNALPVLSALSNPANGIICAGENVSITASGAISYVWNKGITNGVPFNPTLTDTYTVTGTDINGCSNTINKTITVNAIPILTVAINPTNGIICANDPVTLTATGANTYSWDNGIFNGVTFNPNRTLTYTVTGTDINGCKNTSTKTVAITALPIIKANTSNATVCEGDKITLSGSGGTTYVWSDKITDGILFSPASSKKYFVTGTDVNGCKNIDSISIVVNPNPIVTISNANICEGATANLLATVNFGLPSDYNYYWTVPLSAITPSNAATLNSGVAGTYSIYVVNKNTQCKSATNTATIIVNPLPIIGNITAPLQIIKIDEQVILKANPIAGTPPYTYYWNLSDPTKVIGSGQQNFNFKGIGSGIINVSYHVMDANNCVSAESANYQINIMATDLFFVPTAFSPNSDALNDNLKIIAKPEVTALNYFKIFNRYGYLVFETNNLKWGWDGRKNGVMQEPDAYYWIAEYKTILGETLKASGQTVLIK